MELLGPLEGILWVSPYLTMLGGRPQHRNCRSSWVLSLDAVERFPEARLLQLLHLPPYDATTASNTGFLVNTNMRPYLLSLFVGITYAATTPQLAAEPAGVALAALSATHSSHNSDASSEGALMSDEAKTRDRANIIEPMIGPGILNYRDGIPDGETLFDLIPALGKLPSNPSNQCILFP